MDRYKRLGHAIVGMAALALVGLIAVIAVLFVLADVTDFLWGRDTLRPGHGVIGATILVGTAILGSVLLMRTERSE